MSSVAELIEREINAYFGKSPGEYNRYEADLRKRFTAVAEAAARHAVQATANHCWGANMLSDQENSIVSAVLGRDGGKP